MKSFKGNRQCKNPDIATVCFSWIFSSLLKSSERVHWWHLAPFHLRGNTNREGKTTFPCPDEEIYHQHKKQKQKRKKPTVLKTMNKFNLKVCTTDWLASLLSLLVFKVRKTVTCFTPWVIVLHVYTQLLHDQYTMQSDTKETFITEQNKTTWCEFTMIFVKLLQGKEAKLL